MLDKPGKSVVYYDTDSTVYVNNGQNRLKRAVLGEWTDELRKDDCISEWISTGPTSYGYLTSLEKVLVKIKGFTLNYENSKIFNLNTMKKLY